MFTLSDKETSSTCFAAHCLLYSPIHRGGEDDKKPGASGGTSPLFQGTCDTASTNPRASIAGQLRLLRHRVLQLRGVERVRAAGPPHPRQATLPHRGGTAALRSTRAVFCCRVAPSIPTRLRTTTGTLRTMRFRARFPGFPPNGWARRKR